MLLNPIEKYHLAPRAPRVAAVAAAAMAAMAAVAVCVAPAPAPGGTLMEPSVLITGKNGGLMGFNWKHVYRI